MFSYYFVLMASNHLLVITVGGGIGQSLVELKIWKTKVTVPGARLALENLTKLQIFEWDATYQLIVQIYESGERHPLALTKMKCGLWSRPLFPSNRLAMAIHLCPLLNHVDMGCRFPTSKDIQALLNLDSLKFLNTGNATDFSFSQDLLPVLQKFGHKSLEYLGVDFIDEINLGAIVEHCSKLRELYSI